jgi:hypothetical protein
VRSRDVDLVGIDNFRSGMFEGIDPCALKRLDVRVVRRGKNNGGFRETGANASGDGLSIPRNTHRSGERRVVNKILIEVNVLVKDRRGDRLGEARLPRGDANGIINRGRGRRVLSRD